MSSPAPQFESISSLALDLLYGPILTSVCNYWKTIDKDLDQLKFLNNNNAARQSLDFVAGGHGSSQTVVGHGLKHGLQEVILCLPCPGRKTPLTFLDVSKGP